MKSIPNSRDEKRPRLRVFICVYTRSALFTETNNIKKKKKNLFFSPFLKTYMKTPFNDCPRGTMKTAQTKPSPPPASPVRSMIKKKYNNKPRNLLQRNRNTRNDLFLNIRKLTTRIIITRV